MALYRCAACGSPNVVTDIENGGVSYNYVKGAVGTVLLGAGGAAAGIQSKNEQVFKCPDCGITLTYPMSVEEKNAIDAGVLSASARDCLTVYGIPTPWSYFTHKYSHIESGPADEEIKAKDAHTAAIRKINTQTMHIIANAIIEDYQRFQVEVSLLEKTEDSFEERQAAWEIASKSVLETRLKVYTQAKAIAEDACEKAISESEQSIRRELAKLEATTVTLAAEAEKLHTELTTLGLFKGKRKKEIGERLAQIDKETTANKASASKLELTLLDIGGELRKKMDDDLVTRKIEIDKQYPLEESLTEYKAKLLKKKEYLDGIRDSTTLIEKEKAVRNIIIYKFIECVAVPNKRIAFTVADIRNQDGDYETYPLSDIVEVYNMLKEKISEIINLDVSSLTIFNEQAAMAALRDLSNKGILCVEEINRQRYYYIHE